MNQMSKEHQAWAAARQAERDEKNAHKLQRLTTIGLVILTLVISYLFLPALLWNQWYIPAFFLMWLVSRWKDLVPNTKNVYAWLAAGRYPWTCPPAGRRAIQLVALGEHFHDRLVKPLNYLNFKKATDLDEVDYENMRADLPDLYRLGNDEEYARGPWIRAVRWGFIKLMTLNIIASMTLAVITHGFYLPGRVLLAFILSSVICWYISKAKNFGTLAHYMAAYHRLAAAISAHFDRKENKVMRAHELAELARQGR